MRLFPYFQLSSRVRLTNDHSYTQTASFPSTPEGVLQAKHWLIHHLPVVTPSHRDFDDVILKVRDSGLVTRDQLPKCTVPGNYEVEVRCQDFPNATRETPRLPVGLDADPYHRGTLVRLYGQPKTYQGLYDPLSHVRSCLRSGDEYRWDKTAPFQIFTETEQQYQADEVIYVGGVRWTVYYGRTNSAILNAPEVFRTPDRPVHVEFRTPPEVLCEFTLTPHEQLRAMAIRDPLDGSLHVTHDNPLAILCGVSGIAGEIVELPEAVRLTPRIGWYVPTNYPPISTERITGSQSVLLPAIRNSVLESTS